ncbi:helicase-related protein [Synergistes jonesii]|uniref:helicase-related protein n=1 Tax=Synergistes jonesii TaxID=2754 RepID=UPI000690019D|nr:helicase-related protein [Synergistes jonesii]
MRIKNTLIDNSCDDFSMVNTLKTCIMADGINEIMIASGYWDLPAVSLVYDELLAFLQRDGTKLRLLIGRDPNVRAYQKSIPKTVDPKFPEDYIRTDLETLATEGMKEQYQPVVQLLLDYCGKKDKFEIHIFRRNENEETQFLHSKCYIFKGDADSFGIIGSSNFTKMGLEDNAELNYLETDGSRVMAQPVKGAPSKGHDFWFKEKWDLSVPWEKIFLEEVLKPSPIMPPEKPSKIKTPLITPYETYIKYLQMYFGDITDTSVDEQLRSYLPSEINEYSFQTDAVKQCFFIMRQYGGFFLSDVVGLGKTIVAFMVIRKFIEDAEAMGQSRSVLVVTPPAIQKSWLDTMEKFDAVSDGTLNGNVTFVKTGSIDITASGELAREDEELESDNLESEPEDRNYGLIMIDESHNFRNSGTQKYESINSLINNITRKTGRPPFVGLLSATPQNNSPEDLKNQIYLFQRTPNKSDFTDIEGGKLDSFFAEKQREFNECRNSNTPEAIEKLKVLSEDIRRKVLDHIVVRRTRKDIKLHYKEDAAKLSFPTVMPPHKLEYAMDGELCKLFFDTVNAILPPKDDEEKKEGKHLGFYRYAAISFFVSKEHKKLYEKRNLNVTGITRRLAKLMQMLLVKRLESSFTAFRESLENLKQYTLNMIEMIDKDCVFVCPDIDINAEFKKNGYDFEATRIALQEKIKGKHASNRQYRSADFKEEYRERLEEDLALIESLCGRWEENCADPKMDAFKEAVDKTFFDPRINNPSGHDTQRLVIFTEALSTQSSISKYLTSQGYKVLAISADNRSEMQTEIRENFDANCPKERQRYDYNVIVTTEVLAEGVNLHRANVILNYDTPWNATRLMQRIGRVNRIGSQEAKVHVFNFYPTSQSNEQIKLTQKAYAKLQSFHIMFGEDNKIFSEMEQISDADFRRLIEGEESPFAAFISELKNYKNNHTERYDYLKHLKAKELGGQLPGAECSLFMISTDSGRNTLFTVNEEEEALLTTPLSFIEKLHIDENAAYTGQTDTARYTEIRDKVMKAYNLHVAKSHITSHNISKNINDALAAANEIAKQLDTEEAKGMMRDVNKAIRGGNKFAIDKMKEYMKNKNQGSLFGAEITVDLWVKEMFGKIKIEAARMYGEPYTAIYRIN